MNKNKQKKVNIKHSAFGTVILKNVSLEKRDMFSHQQWDIISATAKYKMCCIKKYDIKILHH